MPRFRQVINTLVSIMRITLRICVVYTGITYAFAVLGMCVCAGQRVFVLCLVSPGSVTWCVGGRHYV